jgi:hypothetical protein
MSTNENIQDAIYEEVNESQEKVNYEVALELSDTFLEKNPTIKSIYNKGKMSIGLLPNVDKEFVDKIVGLIPELNSGELVLFNPLIDAINTLASQDFVVEEVAPKRLEGEEDKEFNKRKKVWFEGEYRKITDINKSIGSFNTSLKDSKKIIKEPILNRGKKIDALYNALATFSENRKEVAKNNFENYLIAAQKVKEAQEVKKNAASIAETDALKTANAEATEKIEALSKKSSYADLTNEISDYFSEKQLTIPKLNLQGLNDLSKEISEKVFDVSSQGDLEQVKLLNTAKAFIGFTNLEIQKAKAALGDSAPETETTQAESTTPFNTEVTNDEENFADIIRRLNSIKGDIDGMKKFSDSRLEKINDKFFEQIEIMKKTNNACLKYIGAIQEKYNNK